MDDVVSVGVGTPGSVNKATGYIEFANNLDFNKVPAKEMLEARIHKTVYIDMTLTAPLSARQLRASARA